MDPAVFLMALFFAASTVYVSFGAFLITLFFGAKILREADFFVMTGVSSSVDPTDAVEVALLLE